MSPLLRPRSGTGDVPVPWRRTALLVTGCAGLALAGICVTVGCLLAWSLELTGFGTPTEEKVRGAYIAALVAGAAAGVLLPACLARLVACRRYRAAAATLVAIIAATTAVVALLGTWG